jgi:precorrin-6Y C5,15-methyltransferase (decarboxylating)
MIEEWDKLTFPVTVVGVGPGSREYLLPAAAEAVREADILVGGRNALALFEALGKEQQQIGSDLESVLDYIDTARRDRRVAVLLSGDPGFYSLLPRLRQRFGPGGISVIPGISSLQLACARLGIKWDDLAVASVHGRGLEGLTAIAGAERAAVLTEPRHPPAVVCRYLLQQGSGFVQAWALADLGLPGERIANGSLEVMAGQQGMGNSILILLRDNLDVPQIWGAVTHSDRHLSVRVPGTNREAPCRRAGTKAAGGAAAGEQEAGTRVAGEREAGGAAAGEQEAGGAAAGEQEAGGTAAGVADAPGLEAYLGAATPGLPDELFIRGEAPISQSEVRALTLCKARLRRGMVVYDIGAGTGSWTVEAARLVAPGTVWAVEQNPAAAALAQANLARFGIGNASLVEGSAPEACRGLPPADCVLIGGSGGRLRGILAAAPSWLRPRGRLVLTAVTPETFSDAWQVLQEEPWEEPEAVLLHLARVAPRGGARIWSGGNPVFILAATLSGEGEAAGPEEKSRRGGLVNSFGKNGRRGDD